MIEIRNLTHIYKGGIIGVEDINLTIGKDEVVAVIGVSGAGKSTLLRCINRLLEPTSGEVFINGKDILHCSNKEVQLIRRTIGMVFQNFNLIRRSLVIQNVLMGRLGYTYHYNKEDYQIAMECLRRVKIGDLAYRRTDTLSGGQQQRVGIARALAQEPTVILGDEPVSNLDPTRKHEIMDLLLDIHKQDEVPMVISIHDIETAKEYTNRVIGVVKGKVVFDSKLEDLTDEKIVEIFA